MLSQRLTDALEDRRLSVEMLAQYGVSGCAERGPEWIAIPFVLDGKRVNTKFRTVIGDKKFCQEAGAKKTFWNADAITDPSLADRPLIITEGELDAMAAIQSGYSRSVSVPDGAPPEEIGDRESVKYSFLDGFPSAIAIPEIILATDGDGPGANLMNDLANRLGRARCKWVQYPKGCKDLGDVLRQFGERGVVETINRVRWIKVDGVSTLSALPPLKEQKLHPTGIPGLDKHFKMRFGDLSVVVGIPGHGKTTLINAIMCHAAKEYGWTSGVASFEQRPQVDMKRNLRTFHSGRKVMDMSQKEITEADAWIDSRFAIIVPDFEDEVDLTWMLERVKVCILQYGAKLIVIDPINEMDHIRPPGMTETDYTGFMLKTFKRLAFNYQVHIMLAVHPAKMQRDKEGKIPIPTPYDCAGSAHWYNKPDVVMVVHRLEQEKTLIRVAKSKYHDVIGVPGDCHVKFDIGSGRYLPFGGPAQQYWQED